MATGGPEDALPGSGLLGGRRGRATLVMLALRIAYAYNWFDLGPALPAISSEFGLAPTAWGELVAVFLVGAGLLQVPSGLLARRYGTRAVSIAGAALLGVAGVAAGLAPSFPALLVLRFVGGAGAGLFFSPAIALVGQLYPEGERGVPVGTFSSAFSAGAGLGIFGPALLVPLIGWRGSFVVGGVVLVALLLPALGAVPRTVGPPPPADRRAPTGVPAALRSRGVWAIGIAFIGLEGASLSAAQYFVPFAETIQGWTPALAGAVGALFVFPSFFGGPPGGHVAERFASRRTQMILATALPSALLVLVPVAGLAATCAIAVTFSFGFGMVYAMMYVVAPYLPGIRADEVSLAIGLLNAIQISGGAAVAQVTAFVVEHDGYTWAWVSLAGLVLLPLAALAFVPVIQRPGEAPKPGPE